MSEEEQVVWETKSEDGEWGVKVVHDDALNGWLTVQHRDGPIIFRAYVPLSFGARFGPDVDDVGFWKALAELVIDHLA